MSFPAAETITADTEASPSSPVVVGISGLQKKYGKTQAVEGLGLEVHRGEMFGLIGPDGAGKSSVIKSIAGVLAYDDGEVRVFDELIDSERAAERVKDRLGLMPQGLGNNLYANLSIEENIDYFGRLRLVPRPDLTARKKRLLEMTRLDRFKDRPMKKLSGGMKQKLGLVCTLIHQPQLVLLDEPSTGVDPVSRRDFWAILAELVHEQEMTAIVSTAYMDEVSYFNRVALLMEGKIVAQGQEQSIASLAPGSIVSFQVEDQMKALKRLKKVYPQTETRGPIIRTFVGDVDSDSAVQLIKAVLSETQVRDAKVTEPDLEDVLVSLLQSDPDQAAEKSESASIRADEPQAIDPHTSSKDDGIAIEANELVRAFGNFRAVDGVSFQVRQGDIFGLLGANGAGKTTVIKMLTGLLPPTGGKGIVAGAEMANARGAIKERIGYMSQAFSLYLDLSVNENIELYAGVYGLTRTRTRDRKSWVLEMAGLGDFQKKLTKDLPMGLRQRLALGCALVHSPRVVFLDEPTSGVDPLGRRQFWDTLVRLSREDGVAILVTTHYMSEAEHCDDLALMYAGKIIASGSPIDMRTSLEHESGTPLAIAVDQPLEALKVVRQSGYSAALFGQRVQLLSTDHETDTRRISFALEENGIHIESAKEMQLSMEDVFVQRVLAQEKQDSQQQA